MKAAKFVVHSLNKDGISYLCPLEEVIMSFCPGMSVVVHGRGGRDLTLQVTSLTLLLMDSHCRTIKG